MQVKTFEADDMASALKKVKQTLGPDALILSTRTVRKGGMGLLGKPVLEVTAAVDNAATPRTPAPSEPGGVEAPAAAAPSARNPYQAAKEEISYGDLWRRRRVIDPLEEEVQELKGRISSLDVDSLRNEINELKQLVREAVQAGGAEKPLPSHSGRNNSGLARMMDALLGRGLDPSAAEIVVRRALVDYPPRDRSISVERFLAGAISDLIRVNGPISGSSGGPSRVALVGPTGVGKTTTIAKLAANYLLKHGPKKIALVTIDIFRIAAAEQLKVYGEIMNVPVEVVLAPEELERVFQKHQDKELILIDTAGRSPRDNAGLDEMLKFLGPESGTQNHLVLSATTRETELFGALKRFGRFPLESIIFSKLDECENLGSLLNVHLKSRYPISYLTNGQRVPEDLALAEPGKVASYIMAKN